MGDETQYRLRREVKRLDDVVAEQADRIADLERQLAEARKFKERLRNFIGRIKAMTLLQSSSFIYERIDDFQERSGDE